VNKIRYLALGDSYTIGEGVAPTETWPFQLSNILKAEKEIEITLTVLAMTGWTTGDLLQAMTEGLEASSFSLASVLIGANNQYQRGSSDIYREELNAILSRAVKLTGGRVFCLSIPDWGATPFGKSEGRIGTGADIDSFNEVACRLCSDFLIPFVDITSVSREMRADSQVMVADGLHYTAKMYSIWARKAVPYALPMV
jgi:lysophospholipase L1-like esterase